MNTADMIEVVEERTIQGVEGLAIEHRPHFVKSVRGIDRLAITDELTPIRSEIDWEMVNRAIQQELSHLTERVAGFIPNLIWKSGSHHARHILLSSYRIYDPLDGDDFDPVYAGITIIDSHGSVRVSGDISGDETGHIYFDEGCEFSVAPDLKSVLAAAVEVAGRISSQEQIVVRAIRSPRPSLI